MNDTGVIVGARCNCDQIRRKKSFVSRLRTCHRKYLTFFLSYENLSLPQISTCIVLPNY
jgi:hypothetical protein